MYRTNLYTHKDIIKKKNRKSLKGSDFSVEIT